MASSGHSSHPPPQGTTAADDSRPVGPLLPLHSRTEITHATTAISATRRRDVFAAPEKPLAGDQPYPFGPPLSWDPLTATLIYGNKDAVLIDALTTAAEATALVDWIALRNRNVTTIYLTHAISTTYGLSVLLERFPNAEAIATPESVQLMHEQLSSDWIQFAADLLPGQIPTQLVAAQPFTAKRFTVEGYELTSSNKVVPTPWAPPQSMCRHSTSSSEANTRHQIYDEMVGLYPDWVSPQSWLMFHFPALKGPDQ